MENYDKVLVIKRNDGKTGIIYVKPTQEGLVYYLEQVTTKYGNEPLLVNKQMIKTGNDDIPDLHGIEDAITKKQSVLEFLDDLKKVPKVYAQSVYQPHSNSSIPNSTENVKQNDSFSLSSKNTAPKQYGNYNVYGEDVRYQPSDDVGPVREDIQPTQNNAENEGKGVKENLFPMLDEDAEPVKQIILYINKSDFY